MKTLLYITLLLSSLSLAGWFSFHEKSTDYERLRTGDIVFQDTGGEQGAAVEAATDSQFTHCGIVFEKDKRLYVLEAIQPVQVISLEDFRKRSEIFHARRLRDPSLLNAEKISKGLAWGEKQIGKNYDLLFKWDDENIYCSELVWKIYKEAIGLELCQPQSFRSYFLEKKIVREVIEKRYGRFDQLPLEEPVVAPSDLANSPLLVEVPRN